MTGLGFAAIPLAVLGLVGAALCLGVETVMAIVGRKEHKEVRL